MQVAHQKSLMSEQDYLTGEMESDIKHEFVEGTVYAMAGASRNHERIVQNISRMFGNHLLNSPCEPFGSDMQLKTPSGQFRYPDFMVVCDDNIDNDRYVQAPVILVEVLSRSTRKTDEQIKRIEYINIASLKEYVIIEQDVADITVYRKSDQWRPTHYFLGDEIHFESLELSLSVADIYHRVDNLDVKEWLENLTNKAE